MLLLLQAISFNIFLKAFRRHTQCDPLTDVGSADLTADVDFHSLIRAVQSKLLTFGPVTQRQFLKQMQIDVRLEVNIRSFRHQYA